MPAPTSIHEARDRALGRRREAGVREDRRAHGELRRGGKPLHATNLHVNQSLFPNDTVQAGYPTRRGSSAGSTSRSCSTRAGKSA